MNFEEEKVLVINTWLGQEGLQLKQTSTQKEKEKCRTAKGLFTVLCRMFKPWHNRIIISLQYCMLHKRNNEFVQKRIGRLSTKTVECQYKEYNMLLTEQFICGLNEDGMISEILNEVATLEDIKDATGECILLWAHRVEALRAHKSALSDIKELKYLDIVRWNMQKQDYATLRMHKMEDKCKYCGTRHPSW